jgi:single-stranded-DNA-specific exonuclease
MIRKWIIPSVDEALVAHLMSDLRVSRVTALMLANRGFSDAGAARLFMSPSLHQLSDPLDDASMRSAAQFLAEAVRRGRKITVFGDYDADGICATALLLRCLRGAGARVDYYIPHRLLHGYGLNCEAMDELKGRGTEVVLTVDCGISACVEAAHAAELGLELIVTDHHEPRGDKPTACFLLNPRLPGCNFGCEHLAGVGVAFKLAWAVGQVLSGNRNVAPAYRELLVESLPLVAVGTIADVVPLTGENRVLAHFGLRMLPQSRNAGLRALLQVAGSADKSTLTPYHVAFQIAPRLNAVGRMGDASDAVEMLVTDDAARALDLAEHHQKQNRLRQDMQRIVTDQAFALAERCVDPDRFGCIVLSSADWHPGVLGLAASRLAEHFWRPAFVFCEADGLARGSGRSIPGFPLFDAIRRCEHLVEDYGGHASAAGLSVTVDKLSDFTEAIDAVARQIIGDTPPLPELEVEGEITLDEVSRGAIEEINMLAPFGMGNPEPIFFARGVKLVGNPQIVGVRREHVAFLVRQGDCALRAIAFGKADWLNTLNSRRGQPFSLAFQPILDRYNGSESVQLRAEDFQWQDGEIIERRQAERHLEAPQY